MLPRKQWKLPGIDRGPPAVEAGRSIFYRNGTREPGAGHVLVAAHHNRKIGREVLKGALRGYHIFTLSLEERATCPRFCHHWRTCYGNNMPFVKRVSHHDPRALEAAIIADLERLLARPGRAGILVRLHALGDFFADSYVDFWGNMLARFDRLACYGYTAHAPTSQIGNTVQDVTRDFGWRRFAIRFSNGKLPDTSTVPIRSVDQSVKGAVICPEQTGKTAGCGTCGLCWNTRRNVAFIEH